MQNSFGSKQREIRTVSYTFLTLLIYSLAEKLLEKETIGLPDIVEILGPRPFPHKQNLLDYLEELKERAVEDEAAIQEEAESQSEDEGGDKDEKNEEPKEEPKAEKS